MADKWVWPVPILESGRTRVYPRVSDGFTRHSERRESGQHLGADIMYKRNSRVNYKAPPVETHWYFMPNGIDAVAVGPGVVYAAGHSANKGWWAYVEHPISQYGYLQTAYRHLKRLEVKTGDSVRAGTVIGEIGASPDSGKAGLNHLHFEVWNLDKSDSYQSATVNPAGYLKRWGFVTTDGGYAVPVDSVGPEKMEEPAHSNGVSADPASVGSVMAAIGKVSF